MKQFQQAYGWPTSVRNAAVTLLCVSLDCHINWHRIMLLREPLLHIAVCNIASLKTYMQLSAAMLWQEISTPRDLLNFFVCWKWQSFSLVLLETWLRVCLVVTPRRVYHVRMSQYLVDASTLQYTCVLLDVQVFRLTYI